MDPLALTLAVLASLTAGVGGYVIRGTRERARRAVEVAAATDEASRVLARAREEGDAARKSVVLEAREEALALREAWEKEESKRREDLDRAERRAEERTSRLDEQYARLNERDAELARRAEVAEAQREALRARETAVEQAHAAAREKVESVAGLTAEAAREILMKDLEDEARSEAQNLLRQITEEAQRTAEREAKKILALSIQRMSAEQTAATTVSVVQLPSDEMKGRIIGREGRNIRAFEHATGIDVIIDDTPEAVILSGFDPVRREVARIALEQLVEDGRIHPGRIEDVVARSTEEVEASMVASAEELLYELGIHGVHAEIVRALGRLRFRSSYGQNQLQHAREVAMLAGGMAAEMKLDIQRTKRAAVLHDVGKGLTHEHEGTHVELGYRLCKKHNEDPIVLNAIRAHHDEEPHFFAETFLVSAADAISGSRPGARREMFESYVKRLESLEEVALEQPGVERCFAIQAGRELRIMVEPDAVSDAEMARMTEQVARRIENELQYPGQIKIVVIRETRTVDFAR